MSEWLAFAELEPPVEERLEMQLAVLTAWVANLVRGLAGGHGRTYRAKDFLWQPAPVPTPRRQQSAAEQLAWFKQFAAAHNRQVARQAHSAERTA